MKRIFGVTAVLVAMLATSAFAAVSPDGREYVSAEELHQFAVEHSINLSISGATDLDFEDMSVPVRFSLGGEALPWGLGWRADVDLNRGGEWFAGVAMTGRVLKGFDLGKLGVYTGPGFGYDLVAEEMFAGGLFGVEFGLGSSPVQVFLEGGADYYFQSDADFVDALAPMVNFGLRLQY